MLSKQPFASDENEIRLSSLKWHQAILGETEQARVEADKVCVVILNDARIRALAQNPLLLTTLLFVKRWVGYLSTKKCQLYEEMIKLLLVTWNAAGHGRLEMDVTEPQLAFVAYKMTKKGTQKIRRDELQKIIPFLKSVPTVQLACFKVLGYPIPVKSLFVIIRECETFSVNSLQKGLL